LPAFDKAAHQARRKVTTPVPGIETTNKTSE
jgi:hypothetical protein